MLFGVMLFYRRYYLDPDTDERLSTWRNPLNNVTVTVVHVSNDPVNKPVLTTEYALCLSAGEQSGVWPAASGQCGWEHAGHPQSRREGVVCGSYMRSFDPQVLPLDVPLSYPNPLHGKASLKSVARHA